jgi:hypothetical protein
MSKEIFSRETRRKITVGTLEKFFPYRSNEAKDSLAQVDQFLESGYGMVFVINHFSMRDFFSVMEKLFLESKQLVKKDFLIPIAQHQNENSILAELVNMGDVTLSPIVTKETKKKEAEIISRGKSVPWEMHEEGFGNKQYIKNSTKVLKEGGVVIVAPQGTRQPLWQPFENRSISALVSSTMISKVEKVGFTYLGLEMLGAQNYDAVSGFNILKKYKINMSNPITREQLIDNSRQNNRTLEEEVYNSMLDLVPPAYKPKI